MQQQVFRCLLLTLVAFASFIAWWKPDLIDSKRRQRALEIVCIKHSFLPVEEKGRRLAALLENGMTREQVEQVLGKPDCILGEGLMAPRYWYISYSLIVYFDQNGRVVLPDGEAFQ